jgi:hypothetical protein
VGYIILIWKAFLKKKRRWYKLKLSKKSAMLLSIVLGTTLFVTTALAEVNSKSGYDQLKDAIKYTSAFTAEEAKSFTSDISYAIKSNGTVIASTNTVVKYDIENGITETTSEEVRMNGKLSTSYNYSDKRTNISYSSHNDIYYVAERQSDESNYVIIHDPFKEKEAADAEKIFDAVIGNLKNHVVTEQNSDGSREILGSLNQSQIPAWANAIVSYAVKYRVVRSLYGYNTGYNYDGNVDVEQENLIPYITEDIFVKDVKGKANVNKDGLIESVSMSGVVSGKDKEGKTHDLSVEILIKVTNVNLTVITKPDLTDKVVEQRESYYEEKISNPEKYLGKYKRDVVIEKDGQFVKVGESIVEITNISDGNLEGKHYVVAKEGHENHFSSLEQVDFKGVFNGADYSVRVKYNGDSMRGDAWIHLHVGTPGVSFFPEQYSKQDLGGDFYKVFD